MLTPDYSDNRTSSIPILVVSGLINGHGCFAAAMASNAAHRSTAPRGAAATGIGTLEAVINGQLLACPDFSETVKEDLAADFAHGQIRIAAMIDELGCPYQELGSH
jgi:hypothetical protein